MKLKKQAHFTTPFFNFTQHSRCTRPFLWDSGLFPLKEDEINERVAKIEGPAHKINLKSST
ncbi:MAG: hypothetical protein A3F10_06895 [Coxiella sp. RIFCSPHIGHO2_12_FULL_42_15]|nr:MAG: hypothetical protein A3F10_06895 [Coxiella sp. RIFCSPHIGHO2_12_FULL_42_15]